MENSLSDYIGLFILVGVGGAAVWYFWSKIMGKF